MSACAPPPVPNAPSTHAEGRRGVRQDCAACPLMDRCWGAPSARARALNFLICRYQRAKDNPRARDATFRSLLRLLDPLIDNAAARLAKIVRDEWTAPQVLSTARAEVQGVVAEAVGLYPLGSEVWPTAWIFRAKNAYVRTYLTQRRMLAQQANERERTRFADLDDESLLRLGLVTRMHSDEAPRDSGARDEEVVARLLAVIDDGHTLSLTEYRVVAFYLRGRDGRRGTGVSWLAATLGVPRPYVSRIWARAIRRVVAAAGLRADYLRSLGLDVRTGASRREEIVRLLSQPSPATIEDVAFATGVSDQRVYEIAREERDRNRSPARDARDTRDDRGAIGTDTHELRADGQRHGDAAAVDGQLRRRGVRSRERSLAVTRLPRAPGARSRS